MRKIHFLAIAGAAVILTGCSTPITNNKPVIPAPELDPVAPPATIDAQAGQQQAIMPPPPTPVFEPMTNVTSSGGVDSAKAVTGKGKKATRSGKKGTVVSGKNGNVYIVKSGDTPERIARRLRIRLSALMDANNLDQASARRLQIGQKLVIPTGAAVKGRTSGKAVKKSSASSAPAAVSADGIYVVKSGDTPERIARRLRVRLSDLLTANNLDQASARRLQIGQKLTIPQKGNTVAAKKTKTENDVQPPVPVVTPPVTNTTVDTTTTDGTADNNTTVNPPATGDAPAPAAPEGEPVLTEVTEDISLEDYAKKNNIDPAWLSKNNSGKTMLKKGELIFTPAK
ncbi:MAG: LysM peptidoglycan-binding domain-containing protein [Lentisphaeria bacterium]|nr:LysM peptidoglycan-binding domain-containing protein [Lentisphaeria bacterium]